jgi:hypothetical protein
MSKAAKRLGMDVGSMQVILLAAGPGERKSAEKGLYKLGEAMGDVARGSKVAEKPFKALNINIESLAKAPVGDAFATIADQIAAIPSPALRAKAALDIFGKSSRELMPMLMRGSQGLRDAQKRIDDFGLGFNGADAANIKAAAEASRNIGFFKQGLMNQITIGLAPVLAEVAARMGGIKLSAAGLGQWMLDAFDVGIRGAGTLVDWFMDLGMNWENLKVTGLEWAAVTIKGLVAVGAAVESLIEKLRKAFDLQAGLTPGGGLAQSRNQRAIDQFIAGSTRTGPAPVNSPKWLEEQSAALSRMAQDARKAKEFQEGITGPAGPRMADRAAEFMKSVRNRWAADVKKDVGDPLMDAFVRAQPKIDEFWEKNKGGLETFKEKWQELQAIPKQFFEDLHPGLRAQSALAIYKDLESKSGLNGIHAPQSALAGSKEAFSIISENQVRDAKGDIQQQVAATLRESKIIQEKQLLAGQRVADALEQLTARGL